MFVLERDQNNPILSPHKNNEWECKGAFNPCPVESINKKSTKKILYRAQSGGRVIDGVHRSVSSIGIAESNDGINFDKKSILIHPEKEWEKYGCEDPRITKLGKNYYIFYTGLSTYPFQASGIKVALAKTDLEMKNIEKYPITPFNAKAMVLFPEKINGKFSALLTINTDEPPSEICYVEFDKEEDMWSEDFWKKWKEKTSENKLNLRRRDDDQVELGSTPIKTEHGWLVIYSHIQGYFGNKVFGIEAILLDLKNPKKILARTKGSMMIPEEYYEKIGFVPSVIFPSGAEISGKDLVIYYGATDTHSCKAKINLEKFLNYLLSDKEIFKRAKNNPIISPRQDFKFEEKGTFNPASIDIDGKIHIFYRAVSDENTSTFGYAMTKNGIDIDERLNEPIYKPRANFEKPGGCEDPRAMIIDDKVYFLYTAYDGYVPKVAETSIKISDLKKKNWNFEEPKLVSISSITDKDACILEKKINGKYMIIHRFDDMICAEFIDDLKFENQPVKSSIPIIKPRQGMWDGAKVGLACPLVETKNGFLLFYHGVSHTTHYRVGVALLDKKDPTIVLKRSTVPIFEPVTEYEWKGVVGGVVFPCGIVIRKDNVFLYYGAADYHVGVATAKLSEILRSLE